MSWKKLPPIEAKNIHHGCLCCSSACQVAHMDMLIAVGFGSANVTRDGECIYDEQQAEHANAPMWTVQDAENEAAKDHDHDWQIMKMGPLHGETFQRQGPARWVCVESNEGFA